MNFDFQNGEIILIDKELNWTSFDVVSKLRNSIKKKLDLKKIKVGHAGTLDPLATGLLIICTGKMTKRIDEFSCLNKAYTGKITIGSSTPSYDLETKPNVYYPINHINDELILDTAKKFIGKTLQKPPIFSAVKKDGVRLYKLARKGVNVKIEKREITIHDFTITSINFPEIEFSVSCSKGTYIRSLANDFGKELGSGAHLSELRRTSIGEYSVDKSSKLTSFIRNI
ncbi:MAG: tRNA pseudouridine(55) synthase TruB [Flavobacteriaceae bacterium]|nr:tRNA pseudouridine(55) synthase TruB [Flavobacteriaceae bacterium]|tara:strand:+ start:4427 stop:5107 length:681 start_codon:yes stop_codon:yes gene_type:complete